MERTGGMGSYVRVGACLLGLLAWCIWLPAAAQPVLHNIRILSNQVGLDVAPGHGDRGVAWRDYRNMAWHIQRYDFGSNLDQRIATVFYAEPGVTTHGGRTAWIGYTALGQADVYVHDSAGGGQRRVTTNAAFQNHPHLHGDRLVWQDFRHAAAGDIAADIYAHHFPTNHTERLTSSGAYRDLPRIHGERVVWQDYRHAGPELKTTEIYVYSFVTRQERRLTFGNMYRTHPAIAGDLVVWEDYRNGERGDIYLYDLSRDEEIEISTYPAQKTQPSVYGDWVLWLDYRAGTSLGDIYGYNLKTGQEYALVVHPDHQEPAHIYEARIVWQDYRDGRIDLYAADLPDPAGTAAEELPAPAEIGMMAAPNPSRSEVVFTRIGGGPGAEDLFLYDLAGRLVWTGRWQEGMISLSWDGSGQPGVFMARSRLLPQRRMLVVRL
jgi:beta propeller repeat protein